MESGLIATLVLLVFLVLGFLTIVIGIVIAISKVAKVAAPIVNTVRRVKKGVKAVKGAKVKVKGVAKKAVSAARVVGRKVKVAAIRAASKLQHSVQSDLRALAKEFRKQVAPKARKAAQVMRKKLERAFALLAGEPCAKFDQLWTQHVNLTFYYGTLALTSLEPFTEEQKQKMDYVAGELLQIQEDLSTLMQSCVADNQRTALTQLLKEHILIVAQIAAKWRERKGMTEPGKNSPFDPQLVAAWYKNAADTVKLLESRTGHRNDELQQQYNAHLNWTAGYLIEMTKIRGRFLVPTKRTLEVFAEALDHVPMLAAAFCAQMQVCINA
jgi:hypothetical protein